MLTRRTALLAPAGLGACATVAQAPPAAAFTAWLDGYKQAWEARDAARAGALFTADATYHEMPFDAPMQGRAAIEAYWARVTAAQSNIRFNSEVLSWAGAQGLAHWRATFTSVPDGATIDLDGVFLCQFADAEHVAALREWWHVRVTPAGA
jgi:SnoaL-like domain